MMNTQQEKSPGLLAISALGIVFGDIGTSPLYTFNTVIQLYSYTAIQLYSYTAIQLRPPDSYLTRYRRVTSVSPVCHPPDIPSSPAL
nr:KUP/HAK/KT family potassium transporter [Dickeya oryzae]